MKKKVMHVITGLNRGGAEMLLVNLLSRTDQQKFIPTVVSLTDGGALKEKIEGFGIPVISLGMKRGALSILALIRLFRITRSFNPDIVQGWMYHANLFAILASKLSIKKPKVFWGIFHCIEDLSSRKTLFKLVVKIGAILSSQIDGITNNSFKSINQHAKLGYLADRTTAIPNGVNTDLFHPDYDAYKSVRRELCVSDGTYLVGLIGRFDPLKDHCNFLKAVQIIIATHSDVKFLLVGNGLDESNSWLSEQVRCLELNQKIFLLGERSDIPRLMASLDVSVSSSKSEGMPVVIAESMSCGIPCVVTDVGDSSVLVGESGISVPPCNSEALADAITNILDLPDTDRKSLGSSARRRVMDNFSLGSFVKKYETLYGD